MCGSGSLLIEAALMAQRIAPGLSRASWPCHSWPDHSPAAWREAVDEARGAQRPWQGQLLGNEIHAVRRGRGQLLGLAASWQQAVGAAAGAVHPLEGQAAGCLLPAVASARPFVRTPSMLPAIVHTH